MTAARTPDVLGYLYRNLAVDADVERRNRVSEAIRRWRDAADSAAPNDGPRDTAPVGLTLTLDGGVDPSRDLVRVAAREYGWSG